MSKNEKIFKIAIVGDKGVGKTKFLSICNPIKSNKEDCLILPKKLNQSDFKIKIFKIISQDDEKKNSSILNNDCFCVIVMFDMSKRESFEGLVNWIIWLIDTMHYDGYINILGNYDNDNKKFLCTTKEEVCTFLKLKTLKYSFYEIGNKNISQKINLIDLLIQNTATEYEKYMKDKKGCYIF